MSEGPRANLRDHLRSLAAPADHVARPPRPARGWAIVACMDARFPVERMLGLAVGDAHVVRNAGAVITEDVLRSLVISTRLLGTREIAVIAHTGCGLRRLDEATARERVGASATELHAFASLGAHVREGVRRVADHTALPGDVEVTGAVFHDETGAFEEIVGARTSASLA